MKNYFRNQQPQCLPNQEDKENAGYENFDNANVAASLLMLFHCSAKESRLQELYEFPESAPTSCLQLLFTLLTVLEHQKLLTIEFIVSNV
jgi:hypothetical protein